MTSAFATPISRAIVTMSRFEMCEISWPATASISARSIESSSPVENATSVLSLRGPVANAFGSGDR